MGTTMWMDIKAREMMTLCKRRMRFMNALLLLLPNF